MSRQGVGADALGTILAHFTPTSPLRLDGVMTHLFAADEADGRITGDQLTRLDETLSQISAVGHFAEWLNVGNSAALLAGQAAAIAELAARATVCAGHAAPGLGALWTGAGVRSAI